MRLQRYRWCNWVLQPCKIRQLVAVLVFGVRQRAQVSTLATALLPYMHILIVVCTESCLPGNKRGSESFDMAYHGSNAFAGTNKSLTRSCINVNQTNKRIISKVAMHV